MIKLENNAACLNCVRFWLILTLMFPFGIYSFSIYWMMIVVVAAVVAGKSERLRVPRGRRVCVAASCTIK